MKIVTDHGFPRDGQAIDSDPFDLFKNERDYIAQSGRMKTTVAAMDWAAAEVTRLRYEVEGARAKALEEAAAIADKYDQNPLGAEVNNTAEAHGAGMTYSCGASDSASAIAEAIRALLVSDHSTAAKT